MVSSESFIVKLEKDMKLKLTLSQANLPREYKARGIKKAMQINSILGVFIKI
jgi:hypothetical protein